VDAVNIIYVNKCSKRKVLSEDSLIIVTIKEPVVSIRGKAIRCLCRRSLHMLSFLCKRE